MPILPNDDRFEIGRVMCWRCKGQDEDCPHCRGRGYLEMQFGKPKNKPAQKFKD